MTVSGLLTVHLQPAVRVTGPPRRRLERSPFPAAEGRDRRGGGPSWETADRWGRPLSREAGPQVPTGA